MIFMNGLIPSAAPSIDINNYIDSHYYCACARLQGPRPQPQRESGPVETGPTVPVATALLLLCVVERQLVERQM